MNIVQKMIKNWRNRASSLPPVDTLAHDERVLSAVVGSIGLISFSVVLIVLEIATLWERYSVRTDFVPVPLLSWSALLPFPLFLEIVSGIMILCALAGAVWFRYRPARVSTFFAIILYQSVLLSFGSTVHQTYPFLYISFLFLFLPNLTKESLEYIENRKKTILLFLGAQAFFLLIYTMSGIEKIIEAIFQTMKGEISILHPMGMSMLLSDWSIFTLRKPIFLQYILDVPIAGWLGMITVVYLESFALTILYKPELQRIWGIGLLLFHVATIYSMNVAFFPFLLLINALLLSSPFTPISKSHNSLLFRLPLIGNIFRLFHIV